MQEPCFNVGKVDDNYVHITTHVGITININLLSFFKGKLGKACINSLLFCVYPIVVKELRNLPVFAREENSSIPQTEELFLDITKTHCKRNSTYFTSLMPSCQTDKVDQFKFIA